MERTELVCGRVAVVVDAHGKSVRFARSRRALPWWIDLTTARLDVTRGGPPSRGEHGGFRLRGGRSRFGGGLGGVPSTTSCQVQLGRLTLRRLGKNRVQWIGEVGGAGAAFDMELTADGLVCSVSPTGTGDGEIVSAVWPGEIRLSGPRREVCWSDAQQGSLFRADGKPWTGSVSWDHAAMRVFGLTAGRDALAVIVETPLDAEAAFADDGRSVMTARVEFKPSLGSLGYTRRIRFVPLAEPGHVAVAGAFRNYAQANGLWRSWGERVDENPNVAKLQGAFIACAGYFWDKGADQVAAMKAMRKYGFRRGYLFSPKLFMFKTDWPVIAESNRLTDAQLAEIHKLGYLTAPFLQVEETSVSLGAEKLAVDAAGKRVKRWQINDLEYFEIAKWRVPAMLPQFDDQLVACSGIHFDTLTAMGLIEDWGARGYDRTGDARLRTDIANYYRRRGKVIGSESIRDWGTAVCDLNTSKRFIPTSEIDRRVWTVPLTDLVYHDSVIRSNWEHHSYDDNRCVRSLILRNNHPFGMELTDLLTCSPPILFPEGMLYQYELIPVTGKDGEPELEVNWANASFYRKRFTDPETQAALPKALRVCRLNERHGTARMTAHRFLESGGPNVQESEFETGAHIVVNFGETPYTLPGGRTVAGRSALVEE